jgi:hypothetical protein
MLITFEILNPEQYFSPLSSIVALNQNMEGDFSIGILTCPQEQS